VLRSAIFHEQYDEMVTVKDIDIFSMCEHHMLPSSGSATSPTCAQAHRWAVEDRPRRRALRRRLQVQERLTQEIATASWTRSSRTAWRWSWRRFTCA